uniref:Uncharacterized protein n=1 Tax=viral metagenome TaxID=1070528 RepID=A0A6C0LJ25_9ZZZZ
MPRIGCMYAGSSGSSRGCNKNSPGNGNGKWQGLPGLTNMRSSLVIPTKKRANGNKRDYVFCVNQLAGGVGKRSGQFVSGADGVKDCTPTRDIDYFINILNVYAASKGLLFGLKGITETIRQDIEGVNGTFVDYDDFLGSETDKKLQKEVREAISIINALKINIGVLSSADKQLHVATMLTQLHKEELELADFGVFVLGGKATAYGTKYTEQIPILAVFAGGYAEKCSDVPKAFLAANPYAQTPLQPALGVVNTNGSVVPGTNLTDIITSLNTFYVNYPKSNPFPWVNKNVKLGQAACAAMTMYQDFTNASMTLTIAGTSIPLPTADSSTENSPVGWEWVTDTTVSDYRKIFDPFESTIMSGVLGYGYNKSSSTFSNRVLGSSDDNTPAGVIVRRAFDYANFMGSPGTADYAFQQLSGLAANESPIVFNVLLGYKIFKNNDGFWATDRSQYSLSLIEGLECNEG